MPTLVTTRATARAMSCPSSVVVVTDGDASAGALTRAGVRRLHELERRWTRFSESSELSRLNAADGRALSVGTDTLRLVEEMVRAWKATGGAFDPTLLATLVDLGYIASRDDANRRTSLAPGSLGRSPVGDIVTDGATGRVKLPPGTVLDPGGIGKGLAADLIADELIMGGALGALVEIGGDLAVRGADAMRGGWPISIAAPDGSASSDWLELATGGVATSSRRLRTWSTGGEQRHHLLDPSTLRPTDNEILACTVVAGTAAWAEAFTKVAFVDGTSGALAHYERLGLAARVSTTDGRHHCSSAWAEFGR